MENSKKVQVGNYLQKLKPGSSLYSHILNVFFVVYALLLPFSNAFSTHTGPYFLLLFWVLEGNFKSKMEKIRSERTIWFLLLFFIVNIVSMLWTNNLVEGIYNLKFYFAITVVFVTFYTSLKERYALPVIVAFLLAMFISEIISYSIFFEWWSFKGVSPNMPTPFMHHVLYSIFLVVTIFILLGQILNKHISLGLRILEVIFLLSSTVNLFINGGRTGQLAFIFGLFVFVWFYFGAKVKYLFATFLILSSIFVIAYNFSPVFHTRVHQAVSDIKKIQNNDLRTSWGSRIAMKIVSFDIIKEYPIYGVGIGDTKDMYTQAVQKESLRKFAFSNNPHHVHDQYLHITLQTGIVGLVLFLLFLWYLFRTELNNPLSKAALYAVLTVFIFAFFVDTPLRNYVCGLFAFVTAFLLNQAQSKKTAKRSIKDNIS